MSEDLEWETLERIDRICTRFEDEWQAGRKPEMDAYVHGATGPEAARLVAELTKLDEFYRNQQAAAPFNSTVSLPAPDPAPSPHAPWPTLPGYAVLGELGRGAMGVVYKAWNQRLKRTEAVKVARNGQFAAPAEKALFNIEVEAAGALDHPHIVPVFGSGEVEGMLYLAMRYAEGGTLAQRVKNATLAPREAARLIAKVAAGIDYAHRRGVLHRDLKPANVLLDAAGEPMVADFGLAKRLDAGDPMTATGVVHGTLGYMAPEQARADKNLTVAVDIFGVGAILYALLTGHPPFQGETLHAVLAQTEECSPLSPRRLNPAIDADLAAICMKCLEHDPARRYATAADLVQDLDRYASGDQVRARLPGLWGRAVRVLLRQQFRNVRAWGWVNLLGGLLTGGYHLVAAGCIATEQPRNVIVALGLSHTFFYTLVCVWALRGRSFETGDRHTLSLIIGLGVASVLLPVVHPPPDTVDTAYRLSLYPLLALLHGVAFFIMGSLFWGGFFLYGIGFFVLAVMMSIIPPLSAVLFGLYFGSTQFLLGLYLLRLKTPSE